MATVAGGGSVIGGGASGSTSIEAALAGGSLGGSSGAGWSIDAGPVSGGGATSIANILGGGAYAAPAAAPAAGAQPAAPVAGGGAAATATVDMRRVSGTPQPGGLIDTVIRSASPMAAESHSEGSWLNITDANGAVMQAHVHGAWSSHQDRILEGIQRGYIQVHLHPDGTVHLHDVV
jgi:hypothetical protein